MRDGVNELVQIRNLPAFELEDPCTDISVIMVVYLTGPALFKAVARVLADPDVDDFVIVDNGSSEADQARLFAISQTDDRVRLLQGHGNIGFARGANLGASAARGRFLVFLNPDAFIERGCVRSLADTAIGQPSPCIVGARILNEDGTEQRGARRYEVTPVTTLLSLTRLAEAVPAFRKYEIHLENEPLPDAPVAVPTISGACFGVSRADFRRLKGFDGDFFLHVEDVDLCWRARQMGGVVLFHPTAEVEHLGHTSRVEPFFVEWFKGHGLARYFVKRANNWPRSLLAYVVGPIIVLASVARPLVRRLTGRS
jgi:N-acetylglucosaminyl-diphospho-decaprenol L-rhamnosyltransferase